MLEQAPRKSSVFNASVAGGGTIALVAGVANLSVYLSHFHLEQPTAGAAGANEVQDTTPTTKAFMRTDLAGTKDLPLHFLKLAVGLGVNYKNNLVGALVVAGYLLYDQY